MEPICFLDMDGVLVDFTNGAIRLHGLEGTVRMGQLDWGFTVFAQHGRPDADSEKFWKDMGREFWANLEWTPEGQELLRGVEKIFGPHNVCLLSSPCLTPGCRDGKADWVSKHLPQYERRLIMSGVKHHISGPTKVLVDDNDGNVDKWHLSGGIGVRVPRPWNSRFSRTYHDGTFVVHELLDEIRDTRREALRSAR